MLDQNADILYSFLSFFYEIKFETELINRNNNFAKERSSVQIRIKRVNSKVGVYLTDGSPKANIRRRSSHSFIAITFLHEGSRRGKKKKKRKNFERHAWNPTTIGSRVMTLRVCHLRIFKFHFAAERLVKKSATTTTRAVSRFHFVNNRCSEEGTRIARSIEWRRDLSRRGSLKTRCLDEERN